MRQRLEVAICLCSVHSFVFTAPLTSLCSWSKSGRLLASGSDDQHVNIHTYQPEDSTDQFALTTTIATGHAANIFSVKFMPHSNDQTIVTAAGDHEVRVFDIEYSGANAQSSSLANLASQRRGARRNMYEGVRYLSDGDTDCRVYRSHGDRVKRVVTESSPHLFLTCSEDGEVRQWDLRQPSSAYPSPRTRITGDDSSSVPPPLISYKRYNLDLNSISCSPTQPHYIALGGAHLHCFLHDRRMTGRDILAERGATLTSAAAMSDGEEELMGQATRCVKKFAPNGQPKMRRTDSGHITACKISDAHPNDMVVSWSGDHIYSFDLVRSPDARELVDNVPSASNPTNPSRTRESGERKRKRNGGSRLSLSQEGLSRAGSRQRTEPSTSDRQPGEMALRVQYRNGQTEDIPIDSSQRDPSPVSSLRESVLTESQRISFRLAKSVVQLRKAMFTLPSQMSPSESDPTGHGPSAHAVLRLAADIFPQMLEITQTWRYPVDPAVEDVILQRTLRSRRDSACRFVQASGVIARALSLPDNNILSPGAPVFAAISIASCEGPDISRHEHFGYDFLKAIFLWLDSGIGSLLEGFSCASPMARHASRLPVPKDSGIEAVDDILVPYLLALASDAPVINVDASRFEVDENRVLYRTEQDAVLAFAAALKVPFADLSSRSGPSSATNTEHGLSKPPGEQSRRSALYHWGFKVARGVLMNAGEGVNFAFIDSAFGGIGTRTLQEEASVLEHQADIDPDEEELEASAIEILNRRAESRSVDSDIIASDNRDPPGMNESGASIDEDDSEQEEIDEAMLAAEELFEHRNRHSSEDEEDEDEADDDEEDADAHSDDGENDDEDDEDEDDHEAFGVPFYRSAFERRRLREKVEENIPCSTHTRVYSGHCNVRTVKDVNFFGLDDEYVVSGSDDGNFFIWDRKTGQLLNILEGDGEVVNVLQGHPYEPLLAISGIDHTIKIFSPDARAREAARLGRGVAAADASDFSSISWSSGVRGRRPRRQSRQMETTSEPAMPSDADGRVREEELDDEYVAFGGLASRKRMHQEYQITSQNDVARQGGNQEAFVTVCVPSLTLVLFNTSVLSVYANIMSRGACSRISPG